MQPTNDVEVFGLSQQTDASIRGKAAGVTVSPATASCLDWHCAHICKIEAIHGHNREPSTVLSSPFACIASTKQRTGLSVCAGLRCPRLAGFGSLQQLCANGRASALSKRSRPATAGGVHAAPRFCVAKCASAGSERCWGYKPSMHCRNCAPGESRSWSRPLNVAGSERSTAVTVWATFLPGHQQAEHDSTRAWTV